MRHLVLKSLFALGALAGALPAFATDVGVTVEVSRPGVYGRVDIGRFPQPVLVSQTPVVVVPQHRHVVAAPVQPVPMWVPPGHQKKWRKHCARYNACGVPVVFVQDGWYRQQVLAQAPEARGERGHHGGHPGKGHGRGHGKGHGRDGD